MSEQLKIAMLSVHSCPLGNLGGRDTGGMNVYIRELAQELSKKGHMVDIYTRAHQPAHKQVTNLGHNIRLIHIETGCNEEMPKIAFYSCLQNFICGTETFRNSIDIHYDLIHSHYWLSGLAGKQLQAWWHIPHIVMFHTLGTAKNHTCIGEDEPELRIEGEREVVHACELITAATTREKDELMLHYNAPSQKIAVVPCGVNLDLFKPVDKETARKELGLNHKKIILFVGRIEPLKGIRQLLQALSQITGKEEPSLMIVGGDERSQGEVKALQSATEELHLEDRVSFTEAVVQEKLPLFYSAADVCVIPSYYESFGMVALESLACGTPIVATDVGDMKNIIRHSEAGHVIEVNSPPELADKISRLLYHGKDNEPDAELRRSIAIDYSWSNIADMVLSEYKKVLLNHVLL